MKNTYEINGDTTSIFLKTRQNRDGIGGRGFKLRVLVDTADLDRVKEFAGVWVRQRCGGTSYVIGSCSDGKRGPLLHRWIMDTPEGMVVDHINHCGLDNRRENLRNVSVAVNQLNRFGAASNSRTGILGVVPSGRKFVAQITRNGKSKYLGTFETPGEAARVAGIARTQAIAELTGEGIVCPS